MDSDIGNLITVDKINFQSELNICCTTPQYDNFTYADKTTLLPVKRLERTKSMLLPFQLRARSGTGVDMVS